VIITGMCVNRPPFPLPAVRDDEYEDIRTTVISLLAGVEDPEGGGPAFATVARREGLYHGASVHLAPDVVIEGAPGCSPHMSRTLSPDQRFTEVRVGGHRREGMFVASRHLGLGEVEPVRDILPKTLKALSFDLADESETVAPPAETYSAQEVKEMEDRLRGLGYME
jgi:hypothetical protein